MSLWIAACAADDQRVSGNGDAGVGGAADGGSHSGGAAGRGPAGGSSGSLAAGGSAPDGGSDGSGGGAAHAGSGGGAGVGGGGGAGVPDGGGGSAGVGGAGGVAGSSGSAGVGGSAGTAGSSGAAGSAGAAGSSGSSGSAGMAGSSGSAGADGGTCDDGDPDTVDERHPTQGCGHRTGDWIVFDNGLELDLKTGYGWSPVVARRPYGFFETHCAELDLGGITDWRFATIDDLRTLAGGCANTESGGPCPLSHSSCLDAACGRGVECISCFGGAGPNEGRYCRPEVQSCRTLWSASVCTDCSEPSAWTYGVTNGNFHGSETNETFRGRCVTSSVPGS